VIGISEHLNMLMNSVSQETVVCSNEVLKLGFGGRPVALIGPLPACVVIKSYNKIWSNTLEWSSL